MLNGKYRKLKGKFTLSYGTRNSREEAQLLVYGDGKLIYSSPVLTGGVMPIDFTVDVEGVLRMKIEVISNGYDDHYLVNCGLYQ